MAILGPPAPPGMLPAGITANPLAVYLRHWLRQTHTCISSIFHQPCCRCCHRLTKFFLHLKFQIQFLAHVIMIKFDSPLPGVRIFRPPNIKLSRLAGINPTLARIFYSQIQTAYKIRWMERTAKGTNLFPSQFLPIIQTFLMFPRPQFIHSRRASRSLPHYKPTHPML